jgi:hypothetical protein
VKRLEVQGRVTQGLGLHSEPTPVSGPPTS